MIGETLKSGQAREERIGCRALGQHRSSCASGHRDDEVGGLQLAAVAQAARADRAVRVHFQRLDADARRRPLPPRSLDEIRGGAAIEVAQPDLASRRRPNRAAARKTRASEPRPAARPKRRSGSSLSVAIASGYQKHCARALAPGPAIHQLRDGHAFQPLRRRASHREHPQPRRASALTTLAEAQMPIAQQRAHHVQRTRQPRRFGARARAAAGAIISISRSVAKDELVVGADAFRGNPASRCSSPSARAGRCRRSRRFRDR